MRPTKMLGVSITACVVLFATVAASAYAAAEFALTKGSYPATFLGGAGSSDPGFAEPAADIEFHCEDVTDKGALKSATELLTLYQLHKCTALGGVVICTTSGEPSGLIHMLMAARPVWLNKAQTEAGFLFSKDGTSSITTFECAGTPVIIEGRVLGNLIAPATGVKTNAWTYSIEIEGEKQKYTKVEEGATEYSLTASVNGGAFEPFIMYLTEDKNHFEVAADEAEFR